MNIFVITLYQSRVDRLCLRDIRKNYPGSLDQCLAKLGHAGYVSLFLSLRELSRRGSEQLFRMQKDFV